MHPTFLNNYYLIPFFYFTIKSASIINSMYCYCYSSSLSFLILPALLSMSFPQLIFTHYRMISGFHFQSSLSSYAIYISTYILLPKLELSCSKLSFHLCFYFHLYLCFKYKCAIRSLFCCYISILICLGLQIHKLYLPLTICSTHPFSFPIKHHLYIFPLWSKTIPKSIWNLPFFIILFW